MAGNGTTNGRLTVLTTGTATVTSFSHTVNPAAPTPASVHDCANAGAASLANCIWPSDYVNPGGLKTGQPTPVGLVAKTGLVVQTTGTATVGWG